MAKGKIFCLFKHFYKNMLEKKINLSMLPSLPPIPSSSLWGNQGTDHFKDLTESRMQTKGFYQFHQVTTGPT